MKRISSKALFFIILSIGILLRIIYILQIRKSPFFYSPFGDAEVFHTWSMSIAKGDFMGQEVFFKAPLYPYILAFFYKVLGYNLLIPRILNVLFDSLSILLVFLIGKRIFNLTVGLISAGIASFAGILIYFSGEILGTSLAVLLSLASFYILILSQDRLWRWFISGIIVSLAILVRPNFLLCVPFIVLYILIGKKLLLRRIVTGAIFLAGLAVLISLTAIHNYSVKKDFVLVNYSGGVNFYIGNNPESDGVSAILPGYGNDWDEYSIAETEVGRDLKPSEVSRFWFLKGLRFIFRDPGKFICLYLKKTWHLLNGKEISNNQNIYRYAHQSIVMKPLLFRSGTRYIYFAFSSSLIFAFGISGMILSLKKTKDLALPFLLICSIALSVVIFFISSRYRMSLFAFVIPFSGYSIYYLFDTWKNKRVFLIGLSILVPFLILCNVDPYGVSMENEALEFYNLGNVYLRTGEIEKAKEYYKKGIQENYSFPRLHLNLGSIYFKESNFEEAEREYQKEIDINPLDGRSYHNLSLVLEKQGRLEDAIQIEKKAISQLPRFFDAYRNIGRLYIKKEQYDSALSYLELANKLKKNDEKVLSLLGLVNLKKKKYKNAIVYYSKVVEMVDDDPILFYNLGVSYIRDGKYAKAREYLKKAIAIQDDFAEAHYNLGLICLQDGEFETARKHIEKAISLNPDFLEAKKLIEKLE